MIVKQHFMERIGIRKCESKEERKHYTLSHLNHLIEHMDYNAKNEPITIRNKDKSWFLTGLTVFKFDDTFCWLENQQYEFYGNIKNIDGNIIEFE